MDGANTANQSKDFDVYRDSYFRYLGYTNEVGEAFRPLIPRTLVNASYAVAISYVCADVFDKAKKKHDNGEGNKKVSIAAMDVFAWQMLASVIIPGFTINRITWLGARMLKKAKVNKTYVKSLPTLLGLSAIPLIIHPIDRAVDFLMDNTYRKWTS